MMCANRFCIYYRKHTCSKKENSFDQGGRCKDCTWVEIDEHLLEHLRREQVEALTLTQKAPKKLRFRRKEMRQIAQIREMSNRLAEEYKAIPSLHISPYLLRNEKLEREKCRKKWMSRFWRISALK